MAITLADFTKIWASTSPLTPYPFSDANYQEGWNFIGSTPPARQMWDSIQNQNDEKMKYIVDNFLPKSGGIMTGDIKGNPLTLTADDGNGNTKSLVCGADGKLIWAENDITPQNAGGGQSSQDTSLPNNTQKTIYSFSLTKGTWLLVGRAYFTSNSAGTRNAWFSDSDNGSAINFQSRTSIPANPSGAHWMQVMSILSVATTATYYIVASQNSGSTLTASGGVLMFRLSPVE